MSFLSCNHRFTVFISVMENNLCFPVLTILFLQFYHCSLQGSILFWISNLSQKYIKGKTTFLLEYISPACSYVLSFWNFSSDFATFMKLPWPLTGWQCIFLQWQNYTLNIFPFSKIIIYSVISYILSLNCIINKL